MRSANVRSRGMDGRQPVARTTAWALERTKVGSTLMRTETPTISHRISKRRRIAVARPVATFSTIPDATRPPARDSATSRYARAASRTSQKSRRLSTLPTAISSAPDRQACRTRRARAGAANTGRCRGPIMLKERITTTGSSVVAAISRATRSCARLERPYGVFGFSGADSLGAGRLISGRHRPQRSRRQRPAPSRTQEPRRAPRGCRPRSPPRPAMDRGSHHWRRQSLPSG